MRFTKLAVFGMGAVIAFGACSGAASPGASGGGGKNWPDHPERVPGNFRPKGVAGRQSRHKSER